MKFAARLSSAVILFGAMILFSGCADDEPGKGGTIPPAWDEPGTPRIDGAGLDGMNGNNGFNVSDEQPTGWGQGGSDGAIDERTGVRKVEVPGFPKVLYFGFDTDRIDGSALNVVGEAIAFMQANPNLVLVIEGHCDERGTEEYNRALGERRAIAVENVLRQNNIDLAKIRTVSYGEDKPAVAGSGENAWSQNRRAVLWVGKID